MTRMLAIALAGFACAVGGLATPAAALEFITGTATYDLALDRARTAGIVADLSGRAVFTVRRDCNRYEVESDMTATFVAAEGDTRTLQVTSRHVEDGQSLKFAVNGTVGDVEIERAEGTATRTADGITVSLTAPSEKTFEMKGRFLFPLAMLEQSLNAARRGEALARFDVYNGGGYGEGRLLVSVVIGSPRVAAETPDEEDIAGALGFGDLRRWPMTFSYFPPQASGEQVPAFTSEGVVFENGSSVAATYVYGRDLAIELEFADFKPIPPTPCP